MLRFSVLRALRLLLTLAAIHPGSALGAIDTVRVDLGPLIEAAAKHPEQFAVEVPHFVSLTSAGEWSGAGNTRTLRYAVSVPGAVSLSFHASRIQLPPSATLIVSSEATTAIYRRSDVHGNDLWSRIQPGDALEFTLEVREDEVSQVALDISGFQAGYRALSPDVRSHEVYRRMRIQAAGDPDTQCVENFACNVTAANQASGQATVALTISNRYLCTGTLVNNTARDNTPYILTARHCANGDFETPVADVPVVTVYWNAVSACGEALGSVLYSPNPHRQTGAKTVYARQDTWLLRLDESPVVDDAFLAGFDASGGVVDGGYSIHHALAYNRQYTRWHGPAFHYVMAPEAQLPFELDLLALVHEFGVGGPGASGGALFSQNHRIIGVASLARGARTLSGYDQCPAPNPPAPDQLGPAVMFNPLSAVWNLPGTGSLGSVTLKSLLDPQNTGARSADSMPASRLQFTPWNYTPLNTAPMTLQWSVPNATSCAASGGVSGDGWTDTLPVSGSRQVSYSGEGQITYRLSCVIPGAGTVSGAVTLQWTPPAPATYASVDRTAAWPTSPVELRWKSNYGPCSVAMVDGAEVRNDLPSEGTLVVTHPVSAVVYWRVTCGTAGRSSFSHAYVNFMPPVLEMVTSGTRLKLGEAYKLNWGSYADTCIPTGGSPGDEWTSVARRGTGQAFVTPTTTGTFDYGLRCTGGTLSQTKTFRLTVDESPPFVELLPIQTTVRLAMTPADYIRYSFRTNLSECSRELTGIRPRYQPGSLGGLIGNPFMQEGESFIPPEAAGTGTLTISCRPWPGGPNAGGPGASASIALTVLPPFAPTASISASTRSVSSTGSFTLTWSSSNSNRCELEVYSPEGFNSSQTLEPSGSMVVSGANATTTGNWDYRLACASIDDIQPNAAASVQVRMQAAASTPPNPPDGGGGGSDGGGGGATRLAELLLLCGLLARVISARALRARVQGSR